MTGLFALVATLLADPNVQGVLFTVAGFVLRGFLGVKAPVKPVVSPVPGAPAPAKPEGPGLVNIPGLLPGNPVLNFLNQRLYDAYHLDLSQWADEILAKAHAT